MAKQTNKVSHREVQNRKRKYENTNYSKFEN